MANAFAYSFKVRFTEKKFCKSWTRMNWAIDSGLMPSLLTSMVPVFLPLPLAGKWKKAGKKKRCSINRVQ